MGKRETLYEPSIEGLKYAHLEQRGDENMYRLSGRKIKDGVEGEIAYILGNAQKINQYSGKEVIYISHNEKVRIKAKEVANKINDIFLRLKKRKPFKNQINIYEYSNSEKILKELANLVGPEKQEEFDKALKYGLGEYGLTFSRPSYQYLFDKKKYEINGLI